MRPVAFNPDYDTGMVTISGNDSIPRQVPAEIFPIKSIFLPLSHNWTKTRTGRTPPMQPVRLC